MAKTTIETQSEEKKASKKKQTNSFQTYIHRLLKTAHPKAQIAVSARGQLDKVADILARGLSDQSRSLCIRSRSKKKTISPAEIYLSMDLLFPQEIAEAAAAKARESVSLYKETDKGSHTHPVRREALASLIFSVALSEKYLREFGASDLHVGKMTPIALSAVIEYVVGEILNSAIECAKDLKRVIVKVRHIYLGVSNNSGMSELFRRFNIELMNGGFVPHIKTELLPSQEKKSAQAVRRRKNKKGSAQSEKKSHRFLPGTKALRDIKYYQRTTDYVLQLLPFDESVRKLGNQIQGEDKPPLHFGGGSILSLQAFVEQKTTQLLNKALECTLHRSRDSVNAKDLLLAWKLSFCWVLPTENQLERIGANGIERLARRAGVKRMSKDMYPVARSFMYSLVASVLYKCVHIISYRKIMTIGTSDLGVALESLNVNFTIPPTFSKSKKVKRAGLKETPSDPVPGKHSEREADAQDKVRSDPSPNKRVSADLSRGSSEQEKKASKVNAGGGEKKVAAPEKIEPKVIPKKDKNRNKKKDKTRGK